MKEKLAIARKGNGEMNKFQSILPIVCAILAAFCWGLRIGAHDENVKMMSNIGIICFCVIIIIVSVSKMIIK